MSPLLTSLVPTGLQRDAGPGPVVLAACAAALSLFGCGDGDARLPPPSPSELNASGTYTLTSTVDVPPTVLASQPVADFLDLLRDLRTDPAAALFKVLDEAGVPLAAQLGAAVPGVVRGQLNDAINDYLLGRIASDGELDRVIALSERAFVSFTLSSTLGVPAAAQAASTTDVRGTHAIDGLVFQVPGGVPLPVPRQVLAMVSPLPGALDAKPPVAVAGAQRGAGEATLLVGDHAFGLAYGEILFAALDGQPNGPSLRQRLGTAFDCPGLGASVANRCVLGVCIGHAGDIAGVCEAGLDEIVERVHERLAEANFEALHFASGEARLWDRLATEAADGMVDRIDGGVWSATIDAGMGPRASRATFTGQRAR